MQPLEELPPRQVPVLLDPFRESLTGGLELLAGGASHDAGHAVPIWCPEKLESQKGEAPLLARVKTAEPAQMGLLWSHLEVEFRQPFGQHPKKTVPRPPASGRHTPSHPHIGTTVLLPDCVLAPLSHTPGRGRSADSHLQGR